MTLAEEELRKENSKMRSFLVVSSLLVTTCSLAGKADNYGSVEFTQLNRCMVDLINAHKAPDPKGIKLAQCMKDNMYAFLPNSRVFGDSGAKCGSDKIGVFHSWCWGKLE